MSKVLRLMDSIKWILLLGLFTQLIILTSCTRKKDEFKVVAEFNLSKQIDSVAFGDVKFGITKTDFLKHDSIAWWENKMTEPAFHSLVTEIEKPILIDKHLFRGYYYFDSDDTLYKISFSKRLVSKMPNREYHSAYDTILSQLESKYGKGVSMKTLVHHTLLSWILQNKKIELENFYYRENCMIECSIIEIRLFRKNMGRKGTSLYGD